MLHLITCHGHIMPRLAELLFFFLISSDLAPLKNKNKISIKQVKGLQKNFLQHFFFFGLFIFVLLLFCPILKYRKNKSAKDSYELII